MSVENKDICKDCGHKFVKGMTWCDQITEIFHDNHCENCSVENFMYYQVDY